VTSAEWSTRGARVLACTYDRELVLVAGTGHLVRDADGRTYVDLIAGLGVHNLGHCHPGVVAAVRAQVGRLCHSSNLHWTDASIALAERLSALAGARRVFFANSGTEANEGAIKLARMRAVRRGRTAPEIIAMQDGFHGRSFGSLSATGVPRPRADVGPLLPGFVHATFNDLESVARRCTPQTCAVLLEPVLGEGGVVPATPEFLRGLRTLCDRHDLLLVVDEVQTGCWRCGAPFAHQLLGGVADVVTVGKAFGGGLPFGAILLGERAAEVWGLGDHATTFGGNPLVAAAALATLDVYEETDVVAHGRAVGDALRRALGALVAQDVGVCEVRGLGCMLGVALDRPAAPVIAACRKRGFLVTGTAAQPNVVRLLPPLVLPLAVVPEFAAAFVDVLGAERDPCVWAI